MAGNVVNFPTLTAACPSCSWAPSCIGQGTSQTAEDSADLRCSNSIRRNDHIVRQGDALEYLYMMRSGSSRSYFVNAGGIEQILAFYYPGDLIGFDALGDGIHASSVVALETTSVCRISAQCLVDTSRRLSNISSAVMRSGACQTKEKNELALMLGQKSAPTRFASLLLDLSCRFAARGCSAVEFNLSMQRQDIANYLALAGETVSRLFSEFQAKGVIEVDRRFIKIISMVKLRQLADECPAISQQISSH